MGNRSFREPSLDLDAKSFNPETLKQKEVSFNFSSWKKKKIKILRKFTVEKIDFHCTLNLSYLGQFSLGFHAMYDINIILLIWKMLTYILKSISLQNLKIGKYAIMALFMFGLLSLLSEKISHVVCDISIYNGKCWNLTVSSEKKLKTSLK